MTPARFPTLNLIAERGWDWYRMISRIPAGWSRCPSAATAESSGWISCLSRNTLVTTEKDSSGKALAGVGSRFSDLRQDIKARAEPEVLVTRTIPQLCRRSPATLYGAVRGRPATAHHPRNRRPMSF